MEKILKKVDELASLLEKAIVQEDKRAEENSKAEEENKEVKKNLLEKAKDLKAREEAVKPIEDVAAFKAKADAIMRDANKKMKVAGAEQDLADKKKTDNAKEYAAQKDRIAKEDKRILDDKAGLKKGYDQLRKAEAESENKVLKGLVKKVTN